MSYPIVAPVDSVTKLFPAGVMAALAAALPGSRSVGFYGDVPAGSTSATITHNLGTRYVDVRVFDTSAEPWVAVEVPFTVPAGGNTVVLSFGVAPTTGKYKAVVVAVGATGGGSGGGGGTTTPVAPSITTLALNPLTQAAAFNQTLTATGDPVITWTVVSGAISGMTLSSDGVLSGTPVGAGAYSMVVRATNATGFADKTFAGIVADPPVGSTWSMYTSDSFAGADAADLAGRTTDLAEGGVAKVWSSSVANAFGIVSGAAAGVGAVTGGSFVPVASTAVELNALVKMMPSASVDVHLFSIDLCRSTVSAGGASMYRLRAYSTGNLALTKVVVGTESAALDISDSASFVVGDIITLRRLDNADHTIAYLSVRVNDTEVAAYVDSSPLPAGAYAGFSRDGRTGQYESMTILTQATTLSLPVITTSSLGSMTQGSPVAVQLAATGDPTIVFTSISGLPAGLSLSSSGLLTGIPTGSGAYSYVVRATNSGGFVNKTFTGTIAVSGGSGGGGSGTVFGAEGRYWPTATPRMGDTFDRVVEVDCTWAAISAAITAAVSQTASSAKVKIRVRPGALSNGLGAGSTATGVLQNIGAAGRAWNIIVTPRDGLGSVTVAGTTGCAFVNLIGISIMGIDFAGHATLLRNSTRSHISHTFINNPNFTANGAPGLSDCEYVEVVAGPEVQISDADRAAVRTANGITAQNNGYVGCYFAPSYKLLGQSGHCDTLQLSASGSSPNIGMRVVGCAMWASSNQGMICTETPHVSQLYVEKSLFVAGQSRQGYRYPQDSSMYQSTSALAFVGGAVDITMKDSIVLGTVADGHTFALVSNTKVIAAEVASVASGAFTVDTALATVSPAQLDAWSPEPTVSRQRALWAAQFAI